MTSSLSILLTVLGSSLSAIGQQQLVHPEPVFADRVMLVFDADADGDPDLLTRGASTGATLEFLLRRNDGSGRFGTPSLLVTAAVELNGTGRVVAADVDGDGDADLVYGYGVPRLLRNDGPTFTDVTATNMPALLGPAWLGPTPADVDGDGDVDLYYAKHFGNWLLINNGNGVFTDGTAARLPADGALDRPVAAADVDGDGQLDLISDLLLLRNTGGGFFVDETALRLPAFTEVTAAGDADGDGDVDLARVLPGASGQRLLVNNGTGVFAPAASGYFVGTENVLRTWMLDVDRDGDTDLLEFTSDRQLELRRQQAGSFVLDPAGVRALPRDLAWPTNIETLTFLGDLDGDQDTDFATLVDLRSSLVPDDRLIVFRNDAGRALVEQLSHPGLRTAPVLADVDGDGDLDAVAGERTLRNDGGLRWLPGPSLPAGTGKAVPGDLDGDGDLDLLVLDGGWLENNGTGSFTPTTTGSFAPAGLPQHGVLLDADNDGDLDLATNEVVPQGRIDGFYLNIGAGVFVDVTAAVMPPGGFAAGSIDAADFDNDGDPDLLFGPQDFALAGLVGPMRVLRNTGSAFVNVPGLPPATGLGVARWTDFQGDGLLDIVSRATAIGAASGPRLFEQQPAGTFVDVTTRRLPAGLTFTSFVLGDTNDDGLEDLVVSGTQPALLENQGAAYAIVPHGGLDGASPLWALADLDGDDDPDLLTHDGVLANLLRDIDADPPQLGTTWRVTAQLRPGFAPQAGVAALAIDLQRAPAGLPLPGLGTLYLQSPVALGFLPVGAPAGSAAITVNVPPQPGLQGLELFLQGLAGQGTAAGLLPLVQLRVQ